MKKILITLIILCSTSCSINSRAPISHKDIGPQVKIKNQDETYGRRVLEQLQQKYRIEKNKNNYYRVKNISDRLAIAARADLNPWKLYIFDDDSVINAATTRGNYIFVWTGLLNEVHNDNEIAAIIGHEMAHVLADHTTATVDEQVSSILIGATTAVTQNSFGALGALGGHLTNQVLKGLIVNPESQRKELEADNIGLFITAKAGYNPIDAINFWERMQSKEKFNSQGLAFLSSHPTNIKRIQNLENLLPEAKTEYLKSQSTYTNKARLNPGETFDVSRVGNSRKTWVVKSDWAPVFKRRNTKSMVINNVFYGKAVLAERDTGKRLEISKPTQGFVQKKHLEFR